MLALQTHRSSQREPKTTQHSADRVGVALAASTFPSRNGGIRRGSQAHGQEDREHDPSAGAPDGTGLVKGNSIGLDATEVFWTTQPAPSDPARSAAGLQTNAADTRQIREHADVEHFATALSLLGFSEAQTDLQLGAIAFGGLADTTRDNYACYGGRFARFCYAAGQHPSKHIYKIFLLGEMVDNKTTPGCISSAIQRLQNDYRVLCDENGVAFANDPNIRHWVSEYMTASKRANPSHRLAIDRGMVQDITKWMSENGKPHLCAPLWITYLARLRPHELTALRKGDLRMSPSEDFPSTDEYKLFINTSKALRTSGENQQHKQVAPEIKAWYDLAERGKIHGEQLYTRGIHPEMRFAIQKAAKALEFPGGTKAHNFHGVRHGASGEMFRRAIHTGAPQFMCTSYGSLGTYMPENDFRMARIADADQAAMQHSEQQANLILRALDLE